MSLPETERPSWWDWELELTPHLFKRMADRDFNEVDLRKMLNDAENLRSDIESDRWVVETHHERRRWEVVVEPDERLQLLVVITAYPVETNT